MRCRIEYAARAREREAIDRHHRQSRSSIAPRTGARWQQRDTKIGSDIQVAARSIIRNTGDWRVSQVIADILPGRLSACGIKCYIKHVTRRRRRIGIVAGIRDEGVIRVGWINRDPADETIGLGRGVDARECDTGWK